LEEYKLDTKTREKYHSNKFPNGSGGIHSVFTVISHKLERLYGEDEEAAVEHEDHQSSHEVDQP